MPNEQINTSYVPPFRGFKNGATYSPKTRVFPHNCRTCGTEFIGSQDRLYCSPACRPIRKGQPKPPPRPEDPEHPKPWGKTRFDVLQRDGFKCVYCGRGAEDGAKLTVDHILPKSRGGFTTACGGCNIGKGERKLPTGNAP